jgi:hypothetical protein
MELFRLLYSFDFVLLLAFAVFYYKAAYLEGTSTILWTGLSIIISLASIIFSWGWLGLILGQVILFFAVGIVRTLLSRKD